MWVRCVLHSVGMGACFCVRVYENILCSSYEPTHQTLFGIKKKNWLIYVRKEHSNTWTAASLNQQAARIRSNGHLHIIHGRGACLDAFYVCVTNAFPCKRAVAVTGKLEHDESFRCVYKIGIYALQCSASPTIAGCLCENFIKTQTKRGVSIHPRVGFHSQPCSSVSTLGPKTAISRIRKFTWMREKVQNSSTRNEIDIHLIYIRWKRTGWRKTK